MIVESSWTSFEAHNITRSYAVAGNIYFHGQMRAGIEAALVFRGKRMPAWAMTRLDQVPGFVLTIFGEVPFNIEGFAYLQNLIIVEQ